MKKLFLLMMLLISSIMVLFGCSDDTASEDSGDGATEELILWVPFSGPDGPNMQKIVDDYNESQDEYTVKMEIIPNSEYYTTLDAAFSDGSGPDLAVMHGDQLYTYAQKDQIKNLSETDLASMVTAETYHAKAVEGVTIDGSVYAVPLDMHPLMLYYNKDMFEAAGLDPEAPPTTGEEFIEYAIQLTDAESGQYGYMVPTSWPNQFVIPTIAYQYGGVLVNDDGTPNYTNDGVKKAIQFQYDMINVHQTSPPNVAPDEEWNMFIAGTNAMTFNGPWMMNQANEAGINYGVAVVPQFGDTMAVHAGSHNFVVPTYVSDDKMPAIIDFLEYVNANAIEWAKSGQAPASLEVLNSDEFKAMEFQSTVAASFDYIVQAPPVMNYGTITGPLFAHVESILLGNETVDDGVAAAQSEAEAIINEQGAQ